MLRAGVVAAAVLEFDVVALGLTLHSMERYEGAIAMYHRALRYASEDVICNELLERALDDSSAIWDDDGEAQCEAEVLL